MQQCLGPAPLWLRPAPCAAAAGGGPAAAAAAARVLPQAVPRRPAAASCAPPALLARLQPVWQACGLQAAGGGEERREASGRVVNKVWRAPAPLASPRRGQWLAERQQCASTRVPMWASVAPRVCRGACNHSDQQCNATASTQAKHSRRRDSESEVRPAARSLVPLQPLPLCPIVLQACMIAFSASPVARQVHLLPAARGAGGRRLPAACSGTYRAAAPACAQAPASSVLSVWKRLQKQSNRCGSSTTGAAAAAAGRQHGQLDSHHGGRHDRRHRWPCPPRLAGGHLVGGAQV